jgi:small subunit ribosomal protein S13
MIFFLKKQQSGDIRLYKAMASSYGLGAARISLLCNMVGVEQASRLKSIPEQKLFVLEKLIYTRFFVDRKLRRLKHELVGNLVKFGSLRGLRRKQGLPVRGQRTHTNANTARKLNKF